eukprot:scaffold16206_cov134-Isochrysis_galbana.AAC.2
MLPVRRRDLPVIPRRVVEHDAKGEQVVGAFPAQPHLLEERRERLDALLDLERAAGQDLGQPLLQLRRRCGQLRPGARRALRMPTAHRAKRVRKGDGARSLGEPRKEPPRRPEPAVSGRGALGSREAGVDKVGTRPRWRGDGRPTAVRPLIAAERLGSRHGDESSGAGEKEQQDQAAQRHARVERDFCAHRRARAQPLALDDDRQPAARRRSRWQVRVVTGRLRRSGDEAGPHLGCIRCRLAPYPGDAGTTGRATHRGSHAGRARRHAVRDVPPALCLIVH